MRSDSVPGASQSSVKEEISMTDLGRMSAIRRDRWTSLATVVIASMLIVGCPITLVQPYDEKLFNDTEAFYRKGAGIIDEGMESSPLTDDDCRRIKEPA